MTGQSDAAGNSTSIELNDFGQPTTSTDANGNDTLCEYDDQGNPLNLRDPSGTSTDYSYFDEVRDANQNLVIPKLVRSERQSAPFVPYTIVTDYNYKTAGTGVKGDLIQMTQRWVDSGGNTVGNPVTTYYEYDENGNRTAETKSRSVSSGMEYIRTETTYDAQNRVAGTGIKTATGTTPPSSWTTVSVFPNTQAHITYNKLGKQATSTDGYGRVTTSVYDLTGNLIEIVYPDNTVSRTSYDDFGRAQFVQDRAVANVDGTSTAPATRTTYDAAGRVIRVERCASVTLQRATAVPSTDYFRNNSDDQLKMIVVSSAGDIAASVLSTTRTFYDPAGRVQYSVDGRGTVAQNVYDPAGRLTNSIVFSAYNFDPSQSGSALPQPAGASQQTAFAYDANGNQTSVTDAAGHITTSVYDKANRVKEVQFPATAANGPRSRFTYFDGLGRKIQETDEAGVSTTYTYDFRGLLTSATLAAGTAQPATTVYQYDELGNLIKQTDAMTHSAIFQYDALGRRISRTLPGGASETVAYSAVADPQGGAFQVQQQNKTDFNQRQTIITMDGRDRLTTKQLPAITHTDAENNIVTDFPATAVTYTYSTPNGRSAQVMQSGGVNRTVRYAYNSLGQLRVKYTPEGTITYTYDNLGVMTNISARYTYTWPATMPQGGYVFDSAFAATASLTNPNGAEWAYGYDQLGRLQTVNADPAGGGGSADALYSYDQVGNLQTLTYRNGLKTTYSYNERNWLRMVETKHAGSEVAQVDYDNAAQGGGAWPNERRLSPVGQRNGVAEWISGTTRTVDYDFDPFRRLTKENITSATGPAGTVTYEAVTPGSTTQGYDLVGNRASRKVTGDSLIAAGISDYEGNTFDARDQLQTASQYDVNGNTTNYTANGQTSQYVYDAENRLVHCTTTISGLPVTVNLSYDADGNRVVKTVNGTSAIYLVDDRNPSGYAQVMEEWLYVRVSLPLTQPPRKLAFSYVYGSSLISQTNHLLAINSQPSISYYGSDGLGSVRYLTDAGGNVTDTYAYDAFGIQIAGTGPTPNAYLYAGQQWDGDLGMYYLRARYFNPQTGRFWTADDPDYGDQEDPQSLHLYNYCEGDPVNMVDPSGHEGESISLLSVMSIGTVLFSQISPATAAAQPAAIEAISLSARGTDKGIMERVLLAESRTPYGNPTTYDEKEVFRGMNAMGACVVNRMATKGYPSTVTKVIKQKGQFKGFESYPTYDENIRKTLIEVLDWASRSNAKRDAYVSLINNAKKVAQRTVDKKAEDPYADKGGTYGFRTTDHKAPGGNFVELGEIAGNTFYTIPNPRKK